jgi:uncharacterized protein
MEWFGQAKTSFHQSPNPVILTLKDGSQQSLLSVCRSITPPCQLNPWLCNGHLQTIWAATTKDDIPVFYKRKIFEAEEPQYTGSFTVDFVVEANKAEPDPALPRRTSHFSNDASEKLTSPDSKPMLVAVHGLSGGSHELYLRHVLASLVRERDWEACVVNSRGCGRSKITSHVLYNGRATWDVRQTVKWLRKNFPNRPLFALGFSLGANFLTNVSILNNQQEPFKLFTQSADEMSALRSTSPKKGRSVSFKQL